LKDLYAELSEQCKKYACDLLDQCRSSEEVIAVLNRSKSSSTSSSSSCASSDVEDFDEQLDEEIADLEDAIDTDKEEDEAERNAERQPNDDNRDCEDRLTLDRFKLALKYEQKQVRTCTSSAVLVSVFNFLPECSRR
jgi:hypothetical protein